MAKMSNDQSIAIAELLDVLECPGCLEPIIQAPIYACANKQQQHALCFDCYKPLKRLLKTCPLCSERLTDHRCLRLENLVSKMQDVAAAGYKYPKMLYPAHRVAISIRLLKTLSKSMKSMTAKEHEVNDCQFRLIPCGKCDETIQMNMLAEHLVQHH